MKKTLLLFTLFSTFTYAQITVFEDSFETYPDFAISGITDGTYTWDVLDLDMLNTYTGGADPATWANAGAPMAFQIFNPVMGGVTSGTGDCNTTENIEFAPKTGDKYAAAWAGVPSDTGGAVANDDWLISPPIDLTGATGSSLSFWVKSLSDCYGFESYRIGVYLGSGTPTSGSDFTYLTFGLTAGTWATWAQRTQSLSAYDGQVIRIGIKYQSADAYMLMIDDFKVTAATLSTENFNMNNKFVISPNPANNILNITSDIAKIQSVSIVDLNGRTVKQLEVNNTNSQINVSDLNAGVYMLNIQSEEGKTVKKFIKN